MDNNDALLYQAIENVKQMNTKLKEAFNKVEIVADGAAFSLSMLTVAAEKQIPYKPAEVYTVGSRKAYECKCGARLTEKTKYCKECGQRLEWPKQEG